MQIDFIHRPGNTAACVRLAQGETCTTEGGAMIAMSGGLAVETTTHARGKGGIVKAAKRLLGGESFFLNHFTARQGAGEVWLGTALAGDMMSYRLDGDALLVQAGSYVASSEGVQLDTTWQGFKNLLSGENLFWLRASGRGQLLLSSFGAIYPIEVNGEHIVDTGHIVAFQETLEFSLSKAGKSWLHSFLGGEGLVCRFKGRGTVWCQSHNPKSFGMALRPTLKHRK